MKKKTYLTKTPNNTYRVRYIDAVGKWWSKTFKSKTEAQIFERAIRMGDSLQRWFPETDEDARQATFANLAERWLEHAEHVREISQSCLTTYRSQLRNHILPVIGSIASKELKLDDIESLAKVLKGKKPQTRSYTSVRNSWDSEFFEEDDFLSVGYRREILIVACMITKWAYERTLVTKNPFEKFVLPEKPEQPYDYWRLEDEDTFFDWLEKGGIYYLPVKAPRGKVFQKPMKVRNADELYDIVLFALRSAMRLGEIGALCNRDVNLTEGWVRVRASYSSKEGKMKKTTKNGRYRMIEMNDDMRAILSKRRHVPDAKPVFNIHMNTVKFFSRTCRWANVREIHFHALRHTCLTNLANGYGMDRPLPMSQVQQIAGHSDLKMTQRYVHTHGITNTGSGQWSREQRRSHGKGEVMQEMPSSASASLRPGYDVAVHPDVKKPQLVLVN